MAPYLDPVNRAFIDAGAKAGGPAVYELPFDKARAVLEDVQKHEQAKDIIREKIDAGSVETVLFKPSNVGHPLPLAFYFHGGGWILGR